MCLESHLFIEFAKCEARIHQISLQIIGLSECCPNVVGHGESTETDKMQCVLEEARRMTHSSSAERKRPTLKRMSIHRHVKAKVGFLGVYGNMLLYRRAMGSGRQSQHVTDTGTRWPEQCGEMLGGYDNKLWW